MTVLDEIAQEKQQISQRLMRIDGERTKLSEQLNELEIVQRALNRFGRKAVAAAKQTRRRPANTVAAPDDKRRARGPQPNLSLSLSDAILKAVQVHREGASANEVLDYLTRKLGMTVRPNHLGMALQRHRRAGRLENRDQRWYLPPSPRSKRPGKSA
jgi:hypothetical protein